jgi:exodeoxyribonuclease VII small subunit
MSEDLSGLTFEQLLERLEGITRRMAAGDIGIEAVTDLYEEAGQLHVEAAERLERVRRRLDSLAESPPGA